MDIQQLIEWDKQLLLALNGSDSIYCDHFMRTHTGLLVWVPFFIALLYVIIKNNKWKEALLIVVMVGLTVLLADRISSGIFKPLFHRFRPTHDPSIMDLVDVVNNYRGGKYGFISSHAANSIGIATFLSLVFRRKVMAFALFFWAIMHSYTRIYLGVHFPGDILCGAIVGALIGWGVYALYRFLCCRYWSESRVQKDSRYKYSDAVLVASVLAFNYLILLVLSFF